MIKIGATLAVGSVQAQAEDGCLALTRQRAHGAGAPRPGASRGVRGAALYRCGRRAPGSGRAAMGERETIGVPAGSP